MACRQQCHVSHHLAALFVSMSGFPPEVRDKVMKKAPWVMDTLRTFGWMRRRGKLLISIRAHITILFLISFCPLIEARGGRRGKEGLSCALKGADWHFWHRRCQGRQGQDHMWWPRLYGTSLLVEFSILLRAWRMTRRYTWEQCGASFTQNPILQPSLSWPYINPSVLEFLYYDFLLRVCKEMSCLGFPR